MIWPNSAIVAAVQRRKLRDLAEFRKGLIGYGYYIRRRTAAAAQGRKFNNLAQACEGLGWLWLSWSSSGGGGGPGEQIQ